MKIDTILVPTDFSECAAQAFSPAGSLARIFKSRIICLHVIEPVLAPAMGYAPVAEALPAMDVTDELENSAARELPELASRPEWAGLEMEELMMHGNAASEIVSTANERGVDLIVMSAHGRSGLGRILFGSTAESVVRHARCPVLVIKPPRC